METGQIKNGIFEKLLSLLTIPKKTLILYCLQGWKCLASNNSLIKLI